MYFNGRDQRFEVTYELLSNFARRMNMPFDTEPNQINIIELRGAKPVYSGLAVSTQALLETMIMDYDALHDYKTQIPGLFDKTWALITEILKKDPSLYQELVPHGHNSYLEFISAGCRNIVDSSNATVQPFRQRARDIETEIERLDLAGKRRRVETSGIEDNRCWLELADNVVDRANDTMLLVWQDSLGNPHIRPLLVNIDPGSHYIDYPMGGRAGAAVLAQGSYQASWDTHWEHGYPILSIKKNGNTSFNGIRITGYNLDDAGTPTARKLPGESDDAYFVRVGTGNVTRTRSDDRITVTEYTYTDIGGIYIHAGPGAQNLILNWSAGCTTVAGSTMGSNPANTYDEIFGGDTLTGSKWLSIDPPEPISDLSSFNVIVWDAWSLYRLHLESIGLIAFKPVLQIGATDVQTVLRPGENGEQWVHRMQRALNSRIDYITAFNDARHEIEDLFYMERDRLHRDYPLFVPAYMQYPELVRADEDGVFGNDTAAALRNFQLICFVLLGGGAVQLRAVDINRNELMWERSQWICGPLTWDLLELRGFNIESIPQPECPWLQGPFQP